MTRIQFGFTMPADQLDKAQRGTYVADLDRALQPLLTKPGIIRLGHMSEREFWAAAAATDACLNLRYPSAGETSGIAIRFMGIGKPVIVLNNSPATWVPVPLPADAMLTLPGLALA